MSSPSCITEFFEEGQAHDPDGVIGNEDAITPETPGMHDGSSQLDIDSPGRDDGSRRLSFQPSSIVPGFKNSLSTHLEIEDWAEFFKLPPDDQEEPDNES